MTEREEKTRVQFDVNQTELQEIDNLIKTLGAHSRSEALRRGAQILNGIADLARTNPDLTLSQISKLIFQNLNEPEGKI